MEGLKVVGLATVLLLAVTVLWAFVVGGWRAVTGQARRQQDAVSRAWIEGWNAAMRGHDVDQQEWVRRMDEELGR